MAVYRFRVKGNGSSGVVKYTEGMNIEVADTSARSGENPFNSKIEKLFIQEFADKYNIVLDFSTTTAIKGIFKRDKLDVEEM